jgi:hypothetical protein
MRSFPFQFEVPVTFFEKADAPAGKQRRIGGIISTEAPDRQGETVLADALDLSDWLKNGWYNDNHSRDTDGIVGYPEVAQKFHKGEKLPNGDTAKYPGHWAEGYILNTERGNKIWELGQALQGTGRRLGFSVEGKILRRSGPRTIVKKAEDGTPQWVGSKIAKALVRNVAVTNCPVNTDTGLEILNKSIEAFQRADDDDLEMRVRHLEKMLTAAGNGAPLKPESLESDWQPPKPLQKGTPMMRGTGTGGAPATGLKHIRPPSIPKPPRMPHNKGIAGQPADPGARAGSTGKQSFKGKVTQGTMQSQGIGPSKGMSKSLTDAEAVAWVMRAVPHVSATAAGRIMELTKKLKRSGNL